MLHLPVAAEPEVLDCNTQLVSCAEPMAAGEAALIDPRPAGDAGEEQPRAAGTTTDMDLGVGGRVETPITMPRYDPLSPAESPGGWLKGRLARLELEAQENAQVWRAQFDFELRKLEIEADTAARLRKLELESQAQGCPVTTPGLSFSTSSLNTSPSVIFDFTKYITMVPNFRESEVDT